MAVGPLVLRPRAAVTFPAASLAEYVVGKFDPFGPRRGGSLARPLARPLTPRPSYILVVAPKIMTSRANAYKLQSPIKVRTVAHIALHHAMDGASAARQLRPRLLTVTRHVLLIRLMPIGRPPLA